MCLLFQILAALGLPYLRLSLRYPAGIKIHQAGILRVVPLSSNEIHLVGLPAVGAFVNVAVLPAAAFVSVAVVLIKKLTLFDIMSVPAVIEPVATSG